MNIYHKKFLFFLISSACILLVAAIYVVKTLLSEENRAIHNPVTNTSGSPSPLDGKGSAVIIPDDDIQANSLGTWKIVYTVGNAGIYKGGGVAFHIPPFWGWTEPQNINPAIPGYFTVTCSDSKVELDILTSPLKYVVVRAKNTRLLPRDTITVVYGDTLKGRYPQARARSDRYAERNERFFIKVDGDGDGHFYEIAKHPHINILPGHAVRLVVTAPSIVRPGECFSVNVVAVDSLDNWAYGFIGVLHAVAHPVDTNAVKLSDCKRVRQGVYRFDAKVFYEGIYRFEVFDKQGKLKGISNPVVCRKHQRHFKLFWGDIHGHSQLSDGTGTADDYYRYARFVSGLDVCVLTEHDAHGFQPIDENEKIWLLIKEQANRFYEPGKFVTYTGYEWTNWTYGHKHVLFLKEPALLYSFKNPQSSSPEGLWGVLNEKNAMTISHHPGGGPIGTNWDFYNRALERVVEICSIHGNSEYMGCRFCIYNPKEGCFVQDALSRGYRLGIIASGDTHNGHPGMGDPFSPTGGLVAFYASALTREAIWDALKQRRVYATSGDRIIVYFTINNRWMGEVIKQEHNKNRNIYFSVIGTDRLAKVVLVKNNKDMQVWNDQGMICEHAIQDDAASKGTDFYYLRVIQADGKLAWSSPIWVKSSPGGSEP